MSFRLIEAERAQHAVSLLCSVVGVTRAGYYAWRRRGASARALADAELERLIHTVFADSHGTYGAPRSTPSSPTLMASASAASASLG